MKIHVPNYYKKFHCIADKCKDSCCSAGWEIDIDNKTAEYYKSVSGDFGRKLKENIDFSLPAHFIQYSIPNHTNTTNSKISCPFLNDKKLCEIYINLGEEHLCQICKDHPRYYEWFHNVKEAGIGLCCEEAARIILTETEPFSISEIEVNPSEMDVINCSFEYDEEIYNYLLKTRNKIIKYLENNNKIPLNQRLRDILWFGNVIGNNIDNYLLDDEDIFEVTINTLNSNESQENINTLTSIIEFLQSLEPNDSNWPNYLKYCAHTIQNSYNKLNEFELSNPQINTYIENIAKYFIWRYLMKATFDEEIMSKIKLMYVSTTIIKFLLFCHWVQHGTLTLENCINIAKKYSEEIEYSEENIDSFADACYELECLAIEKLLQI